MTSQRQTDANRRNALLSTGPRTEEGKQTSRQNATRHGLTAETVIVGVENAAACRAFESEIVTEYDPKSVVERELTQRLASLLWRLRRANLIEAGLLLIESKHSELHDGKRNISRPPQPRLLAAVIPWTGAATNSSQSKTPNHGSVENGHAGESKPRPDSESSTPSPRLRQRLLTAGYLRLADMDSNPLERLCRYEAALWRQFLQVLYSLDQAKYHRIAASRGRFTPRPPQW
jgi:hypothetical protein